MATLLHDTLLHDVMVEILSRLPAMSLLKFRYVSKPWESLISDPAFVRKHINQNKILNLFLFSTEDIYSVEYSENSGNAKKLGYPFKSLEDSSYTVKIVGCCDGLICIANFKDTSDIVCLWNPCTKEFKYLPNTPVGTFPEDADSHFFRYGFGYDSTVDDYKVVRILQYPGYDDFSFEVKVYSLKTYSWRKLENIPYFLHQRSGSGLVINSTCYWKGVRSEALPSSESMVNSSELPSSKSKAANSQSSYTKIDVIIAFDFIKEEFKEVPHPPFPSRLKYTDTSLAVLQGQLCMSRDFEDGIHHDFELWLMTGGIGKDFWVKLFTISPVEYILRPICFAKTGEIVMEADETDYHLYDPKHKTLRFLDIHGLPNKFTTTTYIGSLVSLKSGIYFEHGKRKDDKGNNRDTAVRIGKLGKKLHMSEGLPVTRLGA